MAIIEANRMSGIRLFSLLLTLSTVLFTPLLVNRANPNMPLMQANQGARVEISNFSIDEAANRYQMNLAIDCPDRIQGVILNVENESGALVIEERVNPEGNPNLKLEFDGTQLGVPGIYLITIRALDLAGNLMERQDELGTNEEPSVLSSRAFTYNPPDHRVNFTIDGVHADYAGNRLMIMLTVEQPQKIVSYSGFIVNSSGQQVSNIPETVFPNPPRLDVELPPAMRRDVRGGEGEAPAYTVTIDLSTVDNQNSRQTFEGFKPVPPPPPGMLAQATRTLHENRLLAILIVLLSSGTTLFWLIRNRKPAPDIHAGDR
jgi:hypothetical protein